MVVVVFTRKEDPACFVNMEGVGTRIVALGTSTISASTASSRVISSGGSAFLVASTLLVSLCSRDLFN